MLGRRVKDDWTGGLQLDFIHESLMPDPTPNDPAKVPPPSFREIAQTLTRGQPSPVTIEAPQEVRPPGLLVEAITVTLSAT